MSEDGQYLLTVTPNLERIFLPRTPALELRLEWQLLREKRFGLQNGASS